MKARRGILGGTFDPVHCGHLAVAAQCREQLGLDAVWLVPSFQPPHRTAPVAAPLERLQMARLAVAGIPGLEVDDREERRGGVSFAVDTLRQMREQEPDEELVLLLGHDAALDFGGWHEAGAIPRLVTLAVFNRAGSPAMDRDALSTAGIPEGALLLEVESPAVSATEVRRRLAARESVTGMVPASVLEYIRERGLYLNAH